MIDREASRDGLASWRRWHMTLSRFLRDYLYFPLGGNRHGQYRRHANLLVTMLLGGLWHGAPWNFVVWGAIHGAGLVANHAWRGLTGRFGFKTPVLLGVAFTQLLVVLAWVPFRAANLSIAAKIWGAMFSVTAPAGPSGPIAGWMWVLALATIALLFPNAAQIFERGHRSSWYGWQPRPAIAVLLGLGLGLAISSSFVRPSAFLYFRF